MTCQQTFLVIRPEDREQLQDKLGAERGHAGIEIVDGQGATDSIANALARVRPDIDFVAIHDAAAPALREWIDSRLRPAVNRRCHPAAPINGTLKRVANQAVTETVSRKGCGRRKRPGLCRNY